MFSQFSNKEKGKDVFLKKKIQNHSREKIFNISYTKISSHYFQ
jgi:hypothetical protein